MKLTGKLLSLMMVSMTSVVCAADRTWDGGGVGAYWTTPANWDGDATAPGMNDTLYFGGSARLVNTNDLSADTSFAGLAFKSGAGAFTLFGNRITLGGNVTNFSTSAQTVNLDMVLSGTTSIYGSNAAIAVNGMLSGPGGLLVSVTNNTLTLSGSNSYDGVTVVTNGNLSITHANALGSTNGNTVVRSVAGGQLQISGGITVAEPLTLNGERTGSGYSLLSSSGSNTWSGLLTRIGQTRISTSGGSTLVMSGGVTNGGGLFVINSGGTLLFNTLPLNLGGDAFYSDSGGLTVVAVAGNTWGETLVANGTLRMDVTNGLPATTALRVGIAYGPNGLFNMNGFDQTVGQVRNDTTNAGTRIITSATPAILTVNQSSASTYDGRLTGAVALTKTGAGTLTLSGNNTATGLVTVGGGTLQAAKRIAVYGGTTTLWTASSLVVSNGAMLACNVGGSGEFTSSDLDALKSVGAATGGFLSGSLLGLDTSFASGGSFTYASDIGNPGGNTLGLAKLGTNLLMLSGNNSYSGKTAVYNGKLGVADETGLGANPGGSVADQLLLSGGTLLSSASFTLDDSNRGVTLGSAGGTFETPVSTTLSVASVIAGSGSLTKAGPGTLTLSGANTYSGKTFVNGGKLSVTNETALGANPGSSAADQLTLNGGTLLSTATFAIDDSNRGMTLGASGGTFETDPATKLTVAKVIAGSSTLTKTGDGTLALTAANSFSGTVNVNAGTLELGQVDALKNSILNTGATGPQTVTLSLAGPVTYTLGGLQGANALGLGANTLSIGANNQSASYIGALSGSGGLTKTGTGTQTLSGSNTYTGATTVTAGVLQFAKTVALYNGNQSLWTTNTIIVNSGATLALNVGGSGEFASGDLDVLKALGSAAGGFKSGSLLGLDTTNAAGGEFVYSSVIGNPGGNMLGIQKLGLGTLTLSGGNTYTGATWLTAGVLNVGSLTNGSFSSSIGASSNIASKLVFDGGTLRYTGPTTSTDRRFTVSAGKTAVFDVTQPGATLTFSSITNSSLPAGTVIVKNGPGALSFGYDGTGPGGATWGFLGSIDAIVVNEGSFLNVANDTPQLNVSRLAANGPALTLGDGVYLGSSNPLEASGANGEQIVRYIGTNTTATIAAGLFQGPGTGGSNTKTFDVNDGAADIDLLVTASYGIYSGVEPLQAVSDIRKTGAGTLKLSGTASVFHGTTTVRNGRLIVGASVLPNVAGPLGNTNTAVQVADAGTTSSNTVALVFDGNYTFGRGLYVYPYTNGASVSFGSIAAGSAVFSGAILLSNTVQLTSASAGTNAVIVTGVISGPGGISKTGTGTVVLAVSNTYTGTTTVASGTLRLSASNRIADTSSLRLTGGTFAADGFSETMGNLDVDGSATIDFGNGSSVLTFAASAGQTWDGTLTIRNWSGAVSGGGTDQLFVGTSAGGLTSAQLAKIVTPAGQTARQLATGEVVLLPKGAMLMLK